MTSPRTDGRSTNFRSAPLGGPVDLTGTGSEISGVGASTAAFFSDLDGLTRPRNEAAPTTAEPSSSVTLAAAADVDVAEELLWFFSPGSFSDKFRLRAGSSVFLRDAGFDFRSVSSDLVRDG